MSDFLRNHGLQHARLHCPSPSPRACSNSCPLSWWCHSTISSSVIPFPSCLQSFPPSGSFQMTLLCIRWPECWSFSFSISPSKEYSGLISFRMDWFISLLSKGLSRVFSNTTVQNINSSALNFLYGPTLTPTPDYSGKISWVSTKCQASFLVSGVIKGKTADSCSDLWTDQQVHHEPQCQVRAGA